MQYKHSELCNAAICNDDSDPNYKNEVIWYPGEEVCKRGPLQKFQKKQKDINKCVSKGKFKNVDVPYTATDLETRCI